MTETWTCPTCGAKHSAEWPSQKDGVVSPKDKFTIDGVEYCCLASFVKGTMNA